jgi:hypothetical protein
MLKAEPFHPLQVRLNDGTVYVITHPNLSMVTRQRLVIGFPDPSSNGELAADAVYLGWSVISGVDRLVPEGTAA